MMPQNAALEVTDKPEADFDDEKNAPFGTNDNKGASKPDNGI